MKDFTNKELEDNLRYLELLSDQYPTINRTISEIVNLEAVLKDDCGTLIEKGNDKNIEQTLNLEDNFSAPIKAGQKLRRNYF